MVCQLEVFAVAPNRGWPLRPAGYPGRCTIEPAGTWPPALLFVMGPLQKAGWTGLEAISAAFMSMC